MDKQYFIELLQRYQEGNTTGEEKRLVESYYELFRDEPDVLEVAGKTSKEGIRQDILKNIQKDISEEKKPVLRISRRRIFQSVAAIGLVIITIYMSRVLSEGGTQALVKGQHESKTPAATRIPQHENDNTLIFLPDGSKVMLSAGSKLNYPPSFEGMAKREVVLEGQAFFDIKHDSEKPFVVHSGGLETVVLGTAFNIKALSTDNNVEVTVKRGKVKVLDNEKVLGIVTPNKRITYNRHKINSVLSDVQKDDDYLEWQNNDLFIDNLTLSEAVQLIEERYRVKIKIDDPSIEALRFTTTFSKNETLEEAVNSICLFNNLEYNYHKEKGTIHIFWNNNSQAPNY